MSDDGVGQRLGSEVIITALIVITQTHPPENSLSTPAGYGHGSAAWQLQLHATESRKVVDISSLAGK